MRIYLTALLLVCGFSAVSAQEPEPAVSVEQAPGPVQDLGGRSGIQSVPRVSGSAVTIAMTGEYSFYPQDLSVAIGTRVVWKNMAKTALTISNVSGLAKEKGNAVRPAGALPFHGDEIGPGEEFEVTLTVAGTYRYFCLEREGNGMVGEIVVK